MLEEKTVADTGDLAASFAIVLERQTGILSEMAVRLEGLESFQKTAEVTVSNLIQATEQIQGILRKLLEPGPAPKPKPQTNLN